MHSLKFSKKFFLFGLFVQNKPSSEYFKGQPNVLKSFIPQILPLIEKKTVLLPLDSDSYPKVESIDTTTSE